MTLYEICNKLENGFDEETGEIFDDSVLEELNLAKNEKVDAICCYIKDLKGDAKKIKDEADALASRAKSCTKKAESLTKYLENMLAGEEFESARNKVTYRQSKTVEIDDLFAIPEQYLKYSDPTPDKVALGKTLKAGNMVTGCHLEEHSNMQLK